MRVFLCLFFFLTTTPANAAISIFGDLISAGDITLIGDVDILASNVTMQTGGSAGDDFTAITGVWNGNDGLSILAGAGSITFSISNVYNSTLTTLWAAETINITLDAPGVGGIVTLNLLGDIDASNTFITGVDDSNVFNLSLDDDSPISLAGGVGIDVLNVTGGGLAVINGSGSGSITKAGFAPLTFSGIETIQGDVQIQHIPEPGYATLTMLLGLAAIRSRRRRGSFS